MDVTGKQGKILNWESRVSSVHLEGGVHILGEICPRSDPDIAHMRYYLGPLKLK